LRLTLRSQGYRPVPVSSPKADPKADRRFGKAPLMRGWREICINADDVVIRGWESLRPIHGNTGLLCGDVVGVDLDIPHSELAHELALIADEMLGITPLHRVGRAPKSLRCYRIDGESLAKFKTPELFLPDDIPCSGQNPKIRG
jgi:putative DNA primase/helicase